MWEVVVLDYFEVGDSTAGLFCLWRLWYWTILMWEILLLDFFAVGDSDAGLSSQWANEEASLRNNQSFNIGNNVDVLMLLKITQVYSKGFEKVHEFKC